HPKVAHLGGVKADDSIAVDRHLLEKDVVDTVLTSGGVANIFLDASGVDPGDPTTEFMRREIEDYEQARADSKDLLKNFPTRILLPTDVVLNDDGERRPVPVESLPAKLLVYDIGLDTIARYVDVIHHAKTIFFNGPAGVFELDPFSVGTRELLTAVAESDGLSVVGGGHTVAAVEQFGLQDRIDHVSTGGGALINFLAGKELPLVTAFGLSLWEAAFVSLGGSLLGSLLLAGAGHHGSQAGVPTMVSLRPVLGRVGSYAPTALNILQLLGWTAFELLVMAQATA